MYVIASSVLIACLVLSADYGWASYRDWRAQPARGQARPHPHPEIHA